MFGFKLMLPQSLENKSQMIFMLMFSGTEHKYIIQVHKHKVINVLSHNTIHQTSEKVDGALHSPKWQYSVLKKTISSYKCSFLLSIFRKAYLVETTC